MQVQERIVCAANKCTLTGSIILGARHWDQHMHNQAETVFGEWDSHGTVEQGFINQFGEFRTREEAWGIACKAGQILRRVSGDEPLLYSENLY